MNGGAKLAPELRRRVEERFGCTYQENFGTGEGLLSMTRLDDPERNPLHQFGPADIAGRRDPGDRRCTATTCPTARLANWSAAVPTPFAATIDAPEKDRAAFTRDGFYRMGDMVRRVDGNLYVEGRRKDIINRGGEKISCEEVENFIFAHPRIKTVCVVAMPDAMYGEKACAFVIPVDGATIDLDEIKAFLLGRDIAKFKLPERLAVVQHFPISPAGKILRRELRQVAASKVAGAHA